MQPDSAKDDSLQFSLICRPSPYTRAPWMTLVDRSAAGSKLDQVMRHAARWLTRHLDDPKLVLWLTRRGTRIHPEFAEHVDLRLQELDELERSGKTDELRRIRNNAPRAIPRPMMRVLWRVLLAGQVTGAVPAFNLDWLTWRRRFERDGLTLASRLELRDMLTPRVSVLGEPIPWDLGQKASDEAQRIADLVDWKIVLSIDDVHSALENLQQSPRWPEALPVVLDDFSALLRDAMDLARELGGVDDRHDRSYIYLPSIAQDLPNIRWRGWASLNQTHPRRMDSNGGDFTRKGEARRGELVHRAVSGVPATGAFCCHSPRRRPASAAGRLATGRWSLVAVVGGNPTRSDTFARCAGAWFGY